MTGNAGGTTNVGGSGNAGGNGNMGGSAGTAATHAVFDRGSDTILVTQVIGPAGGTLTGPTGSPIAGVSVTFPANALATDTQISLGFNDGTLRNTTGTWSGVAIVLSSAGAKVFAEPVMFGLPGFEAADVVLPYFIDDANVLNPLALAHVDPETGVASFETFHASIYSETKLPPGTCGELVSESVSTGFTAKQNGFQFGNTTTDLQDRPDAPKGGICRGMVFYSLWAFEHPELPPAALVRTDNLDCEKKTAIDAYNQVSNYWDQLLDSDGGFPWLRENLTNQFCALAAALKDGAPVPLTLQDHAFPRPNAHSVLVTGYSPGAGQVDSTGQKCNGVAVHVYDPNYKEDDSRFICYDLASKSLQPYKSYDLTFVDIWVTGGFFINPNFALWPPARICLPALATGDPHLSTFDGVHYDFQRVGEFILAQADNGLNVQARLGPYANSRMIATVIAVAAEIGTDRVEINARGASGTELWVNDSIAAPLTLPSGGSVSLSGFTWPDGTRLDVTDRGGRLDVQLHGLMQGGLRGLLGNSNADPGDEFELRDGTPLSRPLDQAAWASFTQDWRITNDESLFHYDSGQDTSTFTDLTFPGAIASAAGLSPADYAKAKDICVAAGVSVTSQAVLEDCILDVGMTGDASFAASAALMPAAMSVEASICPGATLGAPVTVTNGGFETPHVSGSGYQTLSTGSTVLTGWSVNGSVDITYGGYWQNEEGSQSLDLNGTATGSVSQTIATAPGVAYQVSFSLAGNPNCAPALKVAQVEAAGQTASFQFDVTGHSLASMAWQPARFVFQATDATTTLTFSSLVSGGCGPTLDDVQVARLDCPLDCPVLGASDPSAAASCKDLLDADPSLTDGAYTLDLDGAGASPAAQYYCDMTNGGWTLVANQVPAALLPDVSCTVNPNAFGTLDGSYRLGVPDITSVHPHLAWKLTDPTHVVYFKPSCVVDWTVNYDDPAGSAADCTTGYTTTAFDSIVNGHWNRTSARGIGINNSGSICSIRMYESHMATDGTIETTSHEAGVAAPCDYSKYDQQRVSLWFE